MYEMGNDDAGFGVIYPRKVRVTLAFDVHDILFFDTPHPTTEDVATEMRRRTLHGLRAYLFSLSAIQALDDYRVIDAEVTQP